MTDTPPAVEVASPELIEAFKAAVTERFGEDVVAYEAWWTAQGATLSDPPSADEVAALIEALAQPEDADTPPAVEVIPGEPCPECGGSGLQGKDPESRYAQRCEACQGRGTVPIEE